ncbi:potassium-transporting ATPase subunit KdpC [Pseudomonas sp. MWU12-2037]|uniref:potassium-transporting ATPase subunit KdpC n=1 Tax=Pseudomonas sp. MWU12-2037 TaxID=2928690 RepID=UPI0020101BB2|nr:potassium-transporting ATPase subunit KdpC [Pseudomonas sp. MWU12-2037]
MLALLRPALTLLIALSLITGLAYPLLTTGIARLVFPYQAAGSLVERDGKAVGSLLIGQGFSDPRYFWSRPSATSPMAYNPLASGGSNLGPLNPALGDAIKGRIDALHAADPGNTATIPADLVYSSASGLDPHISIAAALYQAARVSRMRNLPVERVRELIAEHSENMLFGFLGEPRVNVLALNLALDAAH